MKRDTVFFIWIVVAAVFTFLQVCPVFAQKNEEGFWPKEIAVEGGRVIMYQLQPEKLDGNLLESRAAVSIELEKDDGPVFGAIWFDTRLITDRDERTATIDVVHVKNVRFPDQTEEDAQKLKALLEEEIPRWNLVIDMDMLLASLDLADKRDIAAQGINTAPPEIIFVSEPAVLVTIDGEPRLQYKENSNLMRVKNTPFTILLSPSERRYYLYADKGTWYVSHDIKANWKIADRVPSEVAALAPKPDAESEEVMLYDQKFLQPGPPPVVFVSTEPAELISSTGEPEYTPISGTDLLYMSNTDSDVLMHILDRQYYVLLSGRWYRSVSLQGPWAYVAGEDLPPDFSRIPEDSHMGTVLYAVPGTDVAKEAVLDAYIPQTAAVDPNKTSLTVEYDGKPKFEQIAGTNLYYAVNTAVPVIWEGRRYYACDQAVWFVAPGPRGPWTVATYVPNSIYLIPPESPVYNVTFVRVYQATPQVVYVGYTPGYTNTYVYHNAIVYGTGYYWPGWYGQYYYPRPWTWGFHARWNPWSGWGFGISYGTSPFYFAIGSGGWYRGGWWGPSYYRGYRHGYYRGYRRERHVGYRAGYVPGRPHHGGTNIYRSRRNKVRLVPVHDRPYLKKNAAFPKRANNVYVDRQGNVHRKTDTGWQTRQKDKWRRLEGGVASPTGPGIGSVPVKRQKYERYEGRKAIQTRPAVGPIPPKRPKEGSVQQYRTQPSMGIGKPKRPQGGSVQQYRTQPSMGIGQPKRTQGGSVQQRRTQPSKGIGQPKRSQGGSLQQHRAQPSRSIGQPKKPQGGSAQQHRNQSSSGPVPIQKPQKTRSVRGTQEMGEGQLDQSYRARQQGKSRARSFGGSMGVKGSAPPPRSQGGGGKHR